MIAFKPDAIALHRLSAKTLSSIGEMKMNSRQIRDNTSIGSLLRQYRKTRGMSQTALASRIGVTYQQIQKYEKGATALTIERLKQLADALNVPINEFISENNRKTAVAGLSDEELKLVSYFRNTKKPKLRKFILKCVSDLTRL
jgi:transcriptional regulator with XRE-family HTH domain